MAADGEYACRDCGTAIGPVLMPLAPKQTPPPPPRYRLVMLALEREGKRSIKKRYADLVRMHLDKIAKALGAEVAVTALEMFRRLDKRVYQGRSPRVVAATLAYLAAERLGIYVHKRVIAEILKVSIHDKRHGVAPQAASARGRGGKGASKRGAMTRAFVVACGKWVIRGDAEFFTATKTFHNALQGTVRELSSWRRRTER